MMYKKTIKLLLFIIALIPTVNLSGQTRFARPDTVPDYASYRHLDECIAAIRRMKQQAVLADPVWLDTLSILTQVEKRLPQEVVKYAGECVSRIDADTVPLKQVHMYAEALLVADRDEDAEKLYLRWADTIDNNPAGEGFWQKILTYLNAIPVRMDKALSVYNSGLPKFHPDSVSTNVTFRSMVGSRLLAVGDYSLANQIGREIIEITDTMSDKYRTPAYNFSASAIIFPFLKRLMPQEAIDSLELSTEAYRNYMASIWKSVFGHEPDLEIGPFAKKAPPVAGKYWYSNLNSTGEIQAILPTVTPDTPAITIVYFAGGGCHSHYKKVDLGRNNGIASCWGAIHRIRSIMKQYPNIKLTVVSNTFGSFADAPPLNPQQEADTLANYLLGFHGLKGTHVIYETDFIRLADYDNRKVDIETDNQAQYKFGPFSLHTANEVVIVDELGQIFHFGPLVDTRNNLEFTVDSRIKAVMSRAANRGKN